jgi:transcriptional regulator with GAF, ATPase, and Fis domain
VKSRLSGLSLDETVPIQDRQKRGAPEGPLGAIVRVVDATARPQTKKLGATPIKIGKGDDNDIVINVSTVSRQHVELALDGDGVVVTDLGSKNGSFYLGQRIEKMRLTLGARIKLGDEVTLAIEPDQESLAGLAYDGDSYRDMLGTSAQMRHIFAILKRLEGSLATVLVDGESGVGKEVIARAIHEGSRVASGPMVVLNCGALPRELIGSELFGHKRGAFTGATENRKGAFESADGGTLFLDEIGELPVDLQPSLLRALETGDVRPIGGDSSRKVTVRVIAATNRDLEAEVQNGGFREDLFYRLAVVRMSVPPLRERVEDIEPLARGFAKHAGLPELPPAVIEQLKARAWPGNARELRNAVQAYAALGVLPQPSRSKAATLDLGLREMVDPRVPYAEQKDAFVDRFTQAYLERLLENTGGNQSAAARVAGLDRGYLGKLVQKYNLGRLPPKIR